MKKFSSLIVAAILALVSLNAQAQRKIAVGVKGGMGFSSTNFKVENAKNGSAFQNGLSDPTTVYNLGAFVEAFPVSHISFMGGISYRTKGITTNFKMLDTNDINSQNVTDVVNDLKSIQHFVSVEGVLRYYFNKKIIKPYVGVGLRLDQKLATTTEVLYNAAYDQVKNGQDASYQAAQEAVINDYKNQLKNFSGTGLSGVLVGGVTVWKLRAEVEICPDLSKSAKDLKTFSISTARQTAFDARTWTINFNVGINILQL